MATNQQLRNEQMVNILKADFSTHHTTAVLPAWNIYNAWVYGVRPENTGAVNSAAMQTLIGIVTAAGGGTIFIPPGEAMDIYEFALVGTTASGYRYAVLLESNIRIMGGGMWQTVLKSVGVINATPATHFCIFAIDAPGVATAKNNIIIQDLGFIGENTSAVVGLDSNNRGITGVGGQYLTNLVIERCRFEYFYCAGVAIFADIAGPVWIQDCIASNNGENGINCNTTFGVIARNRCHNNRSAGIEGAGTRSVVHGNYCTNNNAGGIACGGLLGGYSLQRGFWNEVSGNVCIENIAYGISVGDTFSFSTVHDNLCALNGTIGLQVVENLPLYPDGLTRYNRIHDNICISNGATGFAGAGIYVSALYNRIERNFCRDEGISGYNQIFGITINGTNANGIEILWNDMQGHANQDYNLQGAQDIRFLDERGNSSTVDLTAVSMLPMENRRRVLLGSSGTLYPIDEIAEINLSGAFALTLPSAAAYPTGKELLIKDVSGQAATYNITVTRAGSDTIQGATTTVINANYGYVRLYSNGGTIWYIST